MSQPMNAGGYIPSWGESKPVGYYPGEDDTDNARCECGRFIQCRHCPTPIDPADIRPGDVVDVIRRVEVDAIDDNYLLTKRGGCLSMDFSGRTFHLVHRPDPDAEAVEALRASMASSPYAKDALDALREHGWDVTRRQNGQEHA